MITRGLNPLPVAPSAPCLYTINFAREFRIYTKKDILDLVIEVIVTSGDINILEIYRRIGVCEFWFYQDGLLTVYSLKNEQYIKVNQSKLLPELNLETLTKYINYQDQYDRVTEFINSLKEN